MAIPGVVLRLLENEGRHGQGRLRAVGRAEGDHRVLPEARGQVEDLPGAEVETDQQGADLRDVLQSADHRQVWSLTKFYSVGFLQSRISEESGFSLTKAQSRFASVVLDSVLGLLLLSTSQPISKSLEGRLVSSKYPSRV